MVTYAKTEGVANSGQQTADLPLSQRHFAGAQRSPTSSSSSLGNQLISLDERYLGRGAGGGLRECI